LRLTPFFGRSLSTSSDRHSFGRFLRSGFARSGLRRFLLTHRVADRCVLDRFELHFIRLDSLSIWIGEFMNKLQDFAFDIIDLLVNQLYIFSLLDHIIQNLYFKIVFFTFFIGFAYYRLRRWRAFVWGPLTCANFIDLVILNIFKKFIDDPFPSHYEPKVMQIRH